MQDHFTHCASLVREADRDRYLAALFAPPEKRDALFALYAFDAEISRVRELAREPILLLLEQAGVRIGCATQSISACPAGDAVARALAVPVGTALLAVERLVYDTDERPVQWLQGLYRPDRYQYEMQLSRVGGIAAKVWVSTELPAQFH